MVAAYQPVIRGGVQHGFEHPVRLGYGEGAHVGVEPFLAPAPHARFADVSDQHGPERRAQVASQQVAVQLDRLGPQARPLLDPGSGVLAEVHAASVRVHPVAADDLSLLEGEPPVGAGLAVERVWGWPVDPVRPLVARLPSAGRKLADAAEPALARPQAARPRRQGMITGSTTPAAIKAAPLRGAAGAPATRLPVGTPARPGRAATRRRHPP